MSYEAVVELCVKVEQFNWQARHSPIILPGLVVPGQQKSLNHFVNQQIQPLKMKFQQPHVLIAHSMNIYLCWGQLTLNIYFFFCLAYPL